MRQLTVLLSILAVALLVAATSSAKAEQIHITSTTTSRASF
jgi:hypothetical protein